VVNLSVRCPSQASLEKTVISSEGLEFSDHLAVEEPLEIRLGFADKSHRAISITMRTPGDDAELAAGFLFTEGIVREPSEIRQIRHCGPKVRNGSGTLNEAPSLDSNTIRVDLADSAVVDLKKLERHFYTTSSCGVCGKSSIEALKTEIKSSIDFNLRIGEEIIRSLPAMLREAQAVFDRTGGLHASALFAQDGKLDILREDVGRHNALDKVIGRRFLDGKTPLADRMLLVSGRASFELVQKALVAGIPTLAAVGAPSSLAVELAKQYGMTLIGFLHEDRFNIYCGAERVLASSITANTIASTSALSRF
jgi:FdhD protein